MAGGAEKAPGWVERLLLPTLSEIKGELKALGARVDSVDHKVDSLRNELKADITRVEQTLDAKLTSLRIETKADIGKVDQRVESLRTELKSDIGKVDQRVASLEQRLEVVRDIETLKARIVELEHAQGRGTGAARA